MTDAFASPKQLISHARDEIKSADDLISDYARNQRGTQATYFDPVTQ